MSSYSFPYSKDPVALGLLVHAGLMLVKSSLVKLDYYRSLQVAFNLAGVFKLPVWDSAKQRH